MKTYRITFSDGSTTEVRAINEEKAVYTALSCSHLHIVSIKELRGEIPPNPVGVAGDS